MVNKVFTSSKGYFYTPPVGYQRALQPPPAINVCINQIKVYIFCLVTDVNLGAVTIMSNISSKANRGYRINYNSFPPSFYFSQWRPFRVKVL